ncbi:hypothetical protein AAG747_03940 [Rapidithrix thailandica]|uniref:Uncharacterized protein n=1 Tax=Rapidithrix thailandica TaxID=413964 RepID=A0AAW9S063_9BACT
MLCQQCNRPGQSGPGKKKDRVDPKSTPNPQQASVQEAFRKKLQGKLKPTHAISTNTEHARQRIQQAEQVQKENQALTPKEKRKTPFDLEALQAAWKRYYTENQSNLNTIQGMVFQEGSLQVQSLKAEVASFLRNCLANDYITIHSEIKETETKKERRLYTQHEKFNYLAEKYPILVDLRNKLGLDLDG